MLRMELMSDLMGIKSSNLSKTESLILEGELFTSLCDELKKQFQTKYSDYFRLMKVNAKAEDEMLEGHLVRYVIDDILATEDYTLQGIAYYTHVSEDLVYDMAIGNTLDPSSTVFRNMLKLHRSVRPGLYQKMMEKIIASYENKSNKEKT
jgi:hypothetical protein